MTSVSVSETKVCPSARSCSASSRQFSMMPLWTTATSPVQSRMGCAFVSVGWPWVAHRVWPMPGRHRVRAVFDHFAQVLERTGAGGGPGPPQRPVGLHGHAGGVVAAVLEALEALEQDAQHLAAAGCSDDAAHGLQATGSSTSGGNAACPGCPAPTHSGAGPRKRAPSPPRRTSAAPRPEPSPRPPPPPSPGPEARCRWPAAAPDRGLPSSASTATTSACTVSVATASSGRGATTLSSTWGSRCMDCCARLGQRGPRSLHEVEQQHAGEHAVAGRRQLGEHDVPRLLAPQGEPFGVERFEHVAVPDRGLAHVDVALGHGDAESQVGHHRDHDGVAAPAGPGRPDRWRTTTPSRRPWRPPRCGRPRAAGPHPRRGRGRGARPWRRPRPPAPRDASNHSRR